MAVQFRILYIFALSAFLMDTFASKISFTHGGYNNIVVAISNQLVQPSNCSQFLIDFEATLDESSVLLHRATDGRAYFRSVSVILPNHWDLSRCWRTVSRSRSESYRNADVRVSVSHPLFGDEPFAHQSQGCGKSGDYVYTTAKFYSNKTHEQGRRLLREWAKYRYGVFDETGYSTDPLYPFWYSENLRQKPTGCTHDKILHGEKYNCDPFDENCSFKPTSDNEDITASIMSYPQLQNAVDFCNDSSHNDIAPTKQNLICEGRSVKDVVFSQGDFNEESERVNLTAITFSYKQNIPPRFVLALDRGGAMDERDHWKFLRIACRRFVLQDLADNTELGVLSFKDSVRYHTDNMTVLSSLARRESVASAIPDFLSLPTSTSSSQESCLLCAVQEAVLMLERSGMTSSGDAIVIVTSGASNVEQIQNAIAFAKEKNVQVSVVAYAYSGPLASVKALHSLADSTGGLMTVIDSRGVGYMSHISMLIELGDSLLAATKHHFNSPNLPVLIHEQEFGDSTNGWVNGSFVLDANLGRDTVLGIYFYSRDNTHIGDIKVIGPDGTEYRGKGEDAMASLYFTPLATIDKPGVWRYSFDRRSQSHQSHFVKVTSKPKVRSPSQQRGTVTASLEIVNADSFSAEKPITLYATVTMGDIPILDARVRAIFRSLGSPASTELGEDSTFIVDLIDSGNADPDITKGDGVYSRYLGKLPRDSGVYSVLLSVDAMDGRAYSIRGSPNPEGDTQCCGSVVNVPQDQRELTGAFTRVVPAGLLVINGSDSIPVVNSSMPTYDSDDRLPPGRVVDLRAQINAQKQRITFQWTAVGDDYDIGTAYAYDLRISTNRHELKNPSFSTAESLPVLVLSQPSGTPMFFSSEFQRYDRPFYVAIRAVDRHGNVGKISNTIEIFMPSPPTTTTTSWTSTVPLYSDSSFNETTFASQWFTGGLSTVHLAAMVAGICVAVIILIVVVSVIVHAKRRKGKEAGKFPYEPPAVVNATLYKADKESGASIKNADYNNVSAIYDGKGEGVPVHWSASQLLQEHEKRRSPTDSYEYNIPPKNYPMQRSSAVYSGSYHINSGSATYSPDDTSINVYYAADSVTPPSVDMEGSPSLDGYSGFKPRPPTMPKPDSSRQRGLHPMGNAALQGSFTSLASERKKRNVTQV